MSPGSLWLAAQALPCHANQTSTWAFGELLSILFPSCFYHWPWSLTMLVETHEPS
jgi:hypothetical protein